MGRGREGAFLIEYVFSFALSFEISSFKIPEFIIFIKHDL
jgi:hypothetical protein